LLDRRAPRFLAGAGVIIDPTFEQSDGFGDRKCEQENRDDQRPEFFHQKVARVKLEKLADAEGRNQQLTDNNALDSTDRPKLGAGVKLLLLIGLA
jgi:hypothetical protein